MRFFRIFASASKSLLLAGLLGQAAATARAAGRTPPPFTVEPSTVTAGRTFSVVVKNRRPPPAARLRYDGKFTPPGLDRSLAWPGNNGVVNWGSVSVDESRQLMAVSSSYMPLLLQLLPREESLPGEQIRFDGRGVPISPQVGTPYEVSTERPFMSPLGIPCNAPPWGRLSLIDLNSRALIWQRPLGTTRDVAPLGIPVPGAFAQGGSMITAGGLVFIAAAQDDYLRAFDIQTGRELWKGRLPAGGQATPMSFVSTRNGKQYVVIAAGGHQYLQTTRGDHVVAFGLPD